jgi:hypothetical protein
MIAPHPHERPLRAAVILVSVLFWAGLGLLLWTLRVRFPDSPFGMSLTDVALLAAAAAILTYVGTWVRKAGRAARLQGHAVEIGADQHPDLDARVRACVKRLGFAETPLAFLYQQPVDAMSYSLRYFGRDYLALNAELIGALTEQQGAIDFFIGYELGRLHDPDRLVRWLLLPGRVFPLLGPTYQRAKIFSYDRHGIGACRNRVDAALALALVASGSRRWKSFSVAHYANQSQRRDPVFDFFELTAAVPYLSRRIAHLRGVATGDGARSGRHPLAWFAAALVPAIGPAGAGAIARAAFALAWLAVLTVASWHGYRQLARAGFVEPLPSRFEHKLLPSPQTPASMAPAPAATATPQDDAYARLDQDLKKLGAVALNWHRKLGGIHCEVRDTARLDLNFRAGRYAFSCDEPVVYTVVESGEFEAGRGAHLRSYNWKDNKFFATLPTTPSPATPPVEPPTTSEPNQPN